LNIFCKLFI